MQATPFTGEVSLHPEATVRDLYGTATVPCRPGFQDHDIVRVDGTSQVLIAGARTAQARMYRLLAEAGIDPFINAEEAAETAALIAEDRTWGDLTDRRDLPFVTIDNEDSRDLDQALFVAESDPSTGDGGFTVWYALADAAYFVRGGSAIGRRALRMGSTYYLPGLAAPMLPPGLSEGLVSLNPDVDRRALTFVIRLDDAGNVLHTDIERSRIRSRAKLSYDGVQQFFDAPIGHSFQNTEFVASLLALRAVGDLRIALARRRGVVDYNRSEALIGIDADEPTRFSVRERTRNDVERWNEQVSLLCNIEGARFLKRAGRFDDDVHSVYRVHLPPLRRRLQELVQLTNELADRSGLDDRWRWDGRADLADWLSGLPADAAYDRLSTALSVQVRYTNRASEFSHRAGPHHALGVDSYARFSSPMREIVGVFTHKEALEALDLIEASPKEQDQALRTEVIESANRAKKEQKRLEKEVQLIAIQQLLDGDLALALEQRPLRRGTIIGVRSTRIYVQLDEFSLHLKIDVRDLNQIFHTEYTLSGVALQCKTSAPEFGIGDGVALRTERFDTQRRVFVLKPERL